MPTERNRTSTALGGDLGRAQTSARARRGAKPLIIRRDFNTVDGAQAGCTSSAVKRTIEDVVSMRTAINASAAQPQTRRSPTLSTASTS